MEPKLLGVKRKDYDGGYTIWSFESEKGMSHCVQRDCGDYYEVTPLKSLDFTKPIVVPVGAPGGEHIPDEVRTVLNDVVLPFEVPFTTLKFPKLPAADPIQRDKVWDEIQEAGQKKMKRDYDQAVGKALTRAKQEAAAVLAIKHVNLDDTGTNLSSVKLNKDSSISIVEKVTESSSDELMKDNIVVEKVTESSSDELMKDNIVVEKVTGSSSDELNECKSACSFVGSGTCSSSGELNNMEIGTGSSSDELVVKDNNVEE